MPTHLLPTIKIPVISVAFTLFILLFSATSAGFVGHYFAVFEVKGDQLTEYWRYDDESISLGNQAWDRMSALFPLRYREEIIQFNILAGKRWAGQFGGDGKNDLDREGYMLSVAKYLLLKETQLANASRPVSSRRGTLDWTLVHEMGHYICLETNAIELFSQSFDGDTVPQPHRRKQPDDYPEDGSPKTYGNFVTSYAERNPGDEEVVETFTTYMTIKELPSNNSLVAKKIRFFNNIPGFPELRQHIQQLSAQR